MCILYQGESENITYIFIECVHIKRLWVKIIVRYRSYDWRRENENLNRRCEHCKNKGKG